MTTKEVAKILIYHSKNGFRIDLKDLYSKISDIRNSNSEMSATYISLATPSNRNVVSTVEIYVMKNATLLDLEVQARELERFIERLTFAIETLPEKEKRIIKTRYFNRQNEIMDFVNVSASTNYGSDWCEKLNKRALCRIAEQLSGIKVSWGE